MTGERYIVLGSPSDPLIRRKIVIFRRVEPGDLPSPGSYRLDESPYLEAMVVEIGIAEAVHREMSELAAARRAVLAEGDGFLSRYDPAGITVATGGTLMLGAWLDYLPRGAFQLGALVALIAIGIGVATKARQARLVARQREQWQRHPRRREHDELARELRQGWERVQKRIRLELGFHTDVRAAEGSSEPIRLVSLDPRPFGDDGYFDPEDFLPIEDGEGVRYECVFPGGFATRVLRGALDVRPTDASAPPAPHEETSRPHGQASEQTNEPPRREEGVHEHSREEGGTEEGSREGDAEEGGREGDAKEARAKEARAKEGSGAP